MTKQAISTIMNLSLAIAVTGALLNVANRGTLGAQIQKLSRFITSGYGAGAF